MPSPFSPGRPDDEAQAFFLTTEVAQDDNAEYVALLRIFCDGQDPNTWPDDDKHHHLAPMVRGHQDWLFLERGRLRLHIPNTALCDHRPQLRRATLLSALHDS